MVLAGFVTGVVCSLIGTQVMLEFGPAVPLRVGVASGAGFLAAQLMDVGGLRPAAARAPGGGRRWSRRWCARPSTPSCSFRSPLPASLAGSSPPARRTATGWAPEAVPFLTAGPVAPLWVSLAVADWAVKLAVALVALVPFRLIVGRLIARAAGNARGRYEFHLTYTAFSFRH